MWTRTLLALALIGLASSAVVRTRKARDVVLPKMDLKTTFGDFLHIMEPLEEMPEIKMAFEYWRGIDSVLREDMSIEEAAKAVAFKVYSLVSQQIVTYGVTFPDIKLIDLINMIELEKYVGDNLNLNRIAGAVQPFLSSAMTYEQATRFLTELYTVLSEEATGLTPDILLTAFKGGIDKVESLGEIDPRLTVFVKRARNVYNGIKDPKVKDIFMEVIAVQIHDMVMNELLPSFGVRSIDIAAEIKKLGVHEFIGEVSQLDDLISKVQPLLSKNVTLNETIGIMMGLYQFMETKATSDYDFKTIKNMISTLTNKTMEILPKDIKENVDFDHFLSLAHQIYSNLDITNASQFSAMVLGNQIYNYVMENIFPMANLSTIDLQAIMDQYQVQKHVQGVVNVDAMVKTLQPMLKGNLTLEQSMQVFQNLYSLIEADASKVNANTMQIMAENILNQYQSMIPSPNTYPTEFKEFMTRAHHTYNNLGDGELKSFFQTVMTNTVFKRLTGLDVSNPPNDITNMFNKDQISQFLGQDVDKLAALFKPMFDGTLDLTQIPFVYLNAFRLFMGDDAGAKAQFDIYERVFQRAIPKMKQYLPNPINNNDAYKKLLQMVDQLKKSLSKEEADFITSIFGQIGGDASTLVNAAAVRKLLGDNFDVNAVMTLIQPVLDGVKPLDQIPGVFVNVYDMFIQANPNVDFEEVKIIFGGVLGSLKIILPDPFMESERYSELMTYVGIASENLDDGAKGFLTTILGGSMDDAMKDFGMGSSDMSGVLEQLDQGALEAMNEMKKYASVLKMDDFSEDDFLIMVDMASDVGTETFGKVMGLADGSAQMNANELSDVPPELFGAMDGNSLKAMTARFDESMTDSFCSNLIETDGETAGELMGAIDCSASFKKMEQSGAIVLDDEYKESFVDSMKKGKAVDQWSDSDWEKAMDFAVGMDPEDFSVMPPTVMLNNMDTLKSQKDSMDEESIDEMITKIGSTFGGDFSQMDGATLGKLGSFIDDVPIEDLEKIPPEQKLAALSSLKGQEMDDEVAAEFAEDVLTAMPDPESWTAENLENVVDFIKYDGDVVDKIPIETLAKGISAIGGHDLDETEAATFADRFLEDDTYKEPTNWDATMLSNAASLMSAMPPAFLDGLDSDNIMTAVTSSDKFAKIDFPKSSGRKILEKVKSKLKNIATDLTPEMLGKMGKMIKSFQSDEINQMGADNLRQGLKHFKAIYEDMEYSTRRNIINKLKELPGGLSSMLNDLGDFFEDLTLDEIDAFPYDQIQPKKLPANETITAKPTPGQARRIYKNIKSRFGSPHSAAGNWTMNMWRFLGRGLCGMPCSDIRKIPLSKRLTSIFKIYADMDDCLDDGQIRCMASKLKAVAWNATSDQPLHSQITKSSIAKYGRFVPYFNVSDIEKFNNSLCGHIIKVIGRYPLDNLPRSNLIELKNYALKCAGKLTNGTLLKEELRMAGDIVCGVEVADLERFDAKLFKNHFRDFSERCDFPADVEQKLLTKGMEMMSLTPATIKVKDLVRLGPAVLRMSESELENIPSTVLFKGAARMIKGFVKKEKKMKKRRKMGMPVQDTSEIRNKFNKRMINVFVEKRNQKVAQGRKRRAVTQSSALTCSDMKKVGSGVTSLTTTQLDITTSQFTSCADFLGAQTGWSSSQKSQLAETAKLAWGTPSSWSTSTLVSAGTIVQGLTDGELATIQITSIDSISALGKYNGWTSTQLSTLFSVWLSSTQSGLPSNIDNSELQSIGEFACGATATQIETIPAISYKGAATKIGQMTSCDTVQLTAYASLAKNAAAFGAVNTWDASTMATIGNVIGGLTSSDISSLTQSQIEALGTDAIAKIPVASFTAFSVTQLGYFSSSQANAVTASQMSALSDAQKAALSGAGAISTSVTVTQAPIGGSSSASVVTSGIVMNIVLVAVAFFMS